MSRTLIDTNRTLTGTRTALGSVIRGNLAYNGDFEIAPAFTAATTTTARWVDGTAGGSNASLGYGWSFISKVGTASIQFDTAEFHSGSKSLKLSITATSSQCVASINKATSNIKFGGIKLSSSTAYKVSFWMKTNVTSGTATTGARLTTNERTAAGTFVSSNNSTGILTTTGWTQYTFTYTSSATANNWLDIQPQITGNNGAATLIMDAWFDDIVITPAVPRTLA